MALNYQLVPISFREGIDTKTDRKQVLSTKLLELENGVFSTLGAITKRYGYDLMSKAIDGGDAIGEGSALSTYRNELLQFSGTKVFSRLAANDKWASRGAITSVIQKTKSVVANGSQQRNPDMATALGFECYAWEDSRGGVRYSMFDSKTGTQLTYDAPISTTGSKPKVIACGNYLIIFYIDGASLKYRPINMSAPLVVLPEQVASSNVDPMHTLYDVCAIQDRVYSVFANDSTGSSIVYLDSRLSLSAETKTDGYMTDCVSIWGDASANVWVAYHDAAAVKAYIKNYNLNDVLPVSVVDSITSKIATIAGIETDEGVSTIFYEVDNAILTNHRIRTNTLTRSGTVGNVSEMIRSLGIASKPFIYNDVVYINASYESQYQSKYLTLDSAGRVIASIVPGNGGGLRSNGTVAHVSSEDGVFKFAGAKKQRTVSEGNTLFSLLGVIGVSLDFASANTFITSELGENLFAVGGIVASYDGVSFTEHNFHFYPDNDAIFLSMGSGSGGDVTPPTCVVTSPTPGQALSGTITFSAGASDDTGVSNVQFYVDGVLVGSDSSSPYSISYSTAGLSDGYHTFSVSATDGAGNVGNSASVSCPVNNASADLAFKGQLRGANAAGGEMAWGEYSLDNSQYSTGVPFRGINRAGAEYGNDWDGWTGQTFFKLPNATVTNGSNTSGAASVSSWAAELNFFKSKGFNCIRLPISWERIQHSLNGALDNDYSAAIVSAVSQATNAGFYIVLDLHCYARYATNVFVGSAQTGSYQKKILGDGFLTWAHLSDIWVRLANLFMNNPKVQFELMNEPHDLPMTSTAFFAGCNQVIAAIRATGSKHLIIVPNTRASDVTHWSSYSPGDTVLGPGNGGPTDAVAALAVTDSGNNYCFAMHAYQSNPTSATSYSDLITPVTNWAVTNNRRLYLTEFASVNTDAQGAIAMGGLLSYMNTKSAQWIGWTPWDLQSGSNDYRLTADNHLSATSAMSWFTPYLTANGPGGTTGGGIVSGTDYLFVTNADIDYLKSTGMNFIRLLVTWEVLQPELNGALSTGEYATKMWDLINYATNTKGMYVLLEPHGASDPNFAAYKGVKIGTSPVTASAFANFWSRIAGDARMKNNPKTMIGLMNEPHSMSSSAWWNAAQTALDAIRDAGFKNLVMVPGNAYDNTVNWAETNPYGGDTDTPQKPNTFYAETFTDKLATINPTNYPNGNFCFQGHLYLDANAGGSGTDVVAPSIGVSRVATMLEWCVYYNKRMFIGEFAARAGVTNASAAVTNLLSYLDRNRQNCLGWAWWGYGPIAWWNSYQFTLCPTSSYTVNSPQLALISAYLPAPA